MVRHISGQIICSSYSSWTETYWLSQWKTYSVFISGPAAISEAWPLRDTENISMGYLNIEQHIRELTRYPLARIFVHKESHNLLGYLHFWLFLPPGLSGFPIRSVLVLPPCRLICVILYPAIDSLAAESSSDSGVTHSCASTGYNPGRQYLRGRAQAALSRVCRKLLNTRWLYGRSHLHFCWHVCVASIV
jgi:hypothetical protein